MDYHASMNAVSPQCEANAHILKSVYTILQVRILRKKSRL